MSYNNNTKRRPVFRTKTKRTSTGRVQRSFAVTPEGDEIVLNDQFIDNELATQRPQPQPRQQPKDKTMTMTVKPSKDAVRRNETFVGSHRRTMLIIAGIFAVALIVLGIYFVMGPKQEETEATETPNADDEEKVNLAMVIGVIVGVIVLIAIIAGGWYRWSTRKAIVDGGDGDGGFDDDNEGGEEGGEKLGGLEGIK